MSSLLNDQNSLIDKMCVQDIVDVSRKLVKGVPMATPIFDGANEKPESATERGSIWIPLNPTAKHDDPFGKKFKMTRSDNLFVQMGTRFEELTVKRIYIEDSISFLAPYKELQDNRRSIYYGQPKMSTPYPSGP